MYIQVLKALAEANIKLPENAFLAYEGVAEQQRLKLFCYAGQIAT